MRAADDLLDSVFKWLTENGDTVDLSAGHNG